MATNQEGGLQRNSVKKQKKLVNDEKVGHIIGPIGTYCV